LDLSEKHLEDVRERIKSGIADYVRKAKVKGVVVGVSGGLDSAVTLKLAVEAGVDARALIMPEAGVTDPQDVEDALEFAQTLGVNADVVEVKGIIESVREVYPWQEHATGDKTLAEANVKARSRMILLYMDSNLNERLVLGTGNRSELLLGYFTKHGDGACDLLPIGSLYKTQVTALAKLMEVPENLVSKRPSAGLWRGQTDEDELGAPYEVLDEIIVKLIDEKKKVEEVAEATKAKPDLVKKISASLKANSHKTRLPKIL